MSVHKNLNDNSLMEFGKYKGKKLSEIPNGYFIFLYDRKKLSDALKKYVEESIPMLKAKYISK